MKPSHLILVIMGVLIAVIGVTALAGPPILRMLNGAGDDGRVSIVIATPTMLQGLRQAAEEQAAAAQQQAPKAEDVVQATSSSAGAAPQQGTSAQSAEGRAHLETAMTLRALEDSSLDGLGNELAGRLIESRRFDVKDTSQFMSALREISQRAANEGDEPTIFERLRFWERRTRRDSADPQAGASETESTTQGEATLQTLTSFNEADFQGAGRALNADYVLVVALAPGGFRREYADDPYASAVHIESRWSPTLIFRVFDVRTGNVIVGQEEEVAPPIVVRETGLNESEVTRELQLRLNDRVADVVADRLMSVLAPARIVSTGETITINRGRNDGVREGQIYDVEREQVGGVQDVRYNAATGQSSNGPMLEASRERVGQLRILTVQDNIATAAPVEGALSRGDVVVITPVTTRALTVANTGSAGQQNEIPLGEGQAASAGPRASLAVGDIRVELLEPPNWRRPSDPRMLLSRGIAGHLVESGQVNVLTRSDLDRLRQERELMARSQGIDEANVDIGLATAGNLLTGEAQISATQAGETISVGGQSRQTRTAWRLIATGTVRVQTTDGRTIYSAPFRTERPGSPQDATAVNNLIDAAAADAAASLLVRMFPIRVTSVSGNTVVLNRGPEAGLRVGARLAAFRVDPQTRSRQRLGELVVTDAAPGYSASARFAGARFTTDGTVEVEIMSGGAAPQAGSGRNNNAQQDRQPAQVQW